MKKVLATFTGYWQDNTQMHNVREFSILETREIYFRSNDGDGAQRYYTWSINEFEKTFTINIGEVLLKYDISLHHL